jgi:DNA-binding LytR/AlgR family response regulator
MNNYLSRIVVRSDDEYRVVQTGHIMYLKIDNRTVTLHDIHHKIHHLDVDGLSDIEPLLDRRMFFRANRQFIVNVNYIKKFRMFDKSKVMLNLDSSTDPEIVISQKNSANFKNWISQET